jgi:hypothetical protein
MPNGNSSVWEKVFTPETFFVAGQAFFGDGWPVFMYCWQAKLFISLEEATLC